MGSKQSSESSTARVNVGKVSQQLSESPMKEQPGLQRRWVWMERRGALMPGAWYTLRNWISWPEMLHQTKPMPRIGTLETSVTIMERPRWEMFLVGDEVGAVGEDIVGGARVDANPI
jgi:hypothetical protein